MTTVAEIAALAVAGVRGAVTDAIKTASLIEISNSFYDTSAARYRTRYEVTGTGNVIVETQKPASDIFPEYVIGPGEQLVFLEGFSTRPLEGMVLRFAALTVGTETDASPGDDLSILRVQDILGAGSIFYAVIR